MPMRKYLHCIAKQVRSLIEQSISFLSLYKKNRVVEAVTEPKEGFPAHSPTIGRCRVVDL